MVNDDEPLVETRFAPAGRASAGETNRLVQVFKNQEYLRKFVDALPNIVMVLNHERQIVFYNKNLLTVIKDRFEEESAVYGLRPGEVLDCVHAFETSGGCGTTDFCSTCGAVHAILTSQRGKQDIRDCNILTKTGRALDLRVWATPISIDDEVFTIFSVNDISDEKRRQILERIFFHDLLNIAGGLQGYASLLEESVPAFDTALNEQLLKLTQTLVEEIQSQREILSAENYELKIKPSQLRSLEFVQDMIKAYQQSEVAKGRLLVVAPDTQDIEFTTDAILLQRVIGNMIKNALEACQPGDKVIVGCYVENQEVEFWVHNPYVIPHKNQLQIFQRSYSTKGKGRGLGTYSMKLLGERYLNGKISFSSTTEEGTIFHAYFPIQPF
jgi:signal transduction histidine kinase